MNRPAPRPICYISCNVCIYVVPSLETFRGSPELRTWSRYITLIVILWSCRSLLVRDIYLNKPCKYDNVHFVPFLSISVRFFPFLSASICFCLFLSILSISLHFCQFLSISVRFHAFWSVFVCVCMFLYIYVRFC